MPVLEFEKLPKQNFFRFKVRTSANAGVSEAGTFTNVVPLYTRFYKFVSDASLGNTSTFRIDTMDGGNTQYILAGSGSSSTLEIKVNGSRLSRGTHPNKATSQQVMKELLRDYDVTVIVKATV